MAHRIVYKDALGEVFESHVDNVQMPQSSNGLDDIFVVYNPEKIDHGVLVTINIREDVFAETAIMLLHQEIDQHQAIQKLRKSGETTIARLLTETHRSSAFEGKMTRLFMAIRRAISDLASQSVNATSHSVINDLHLTFEIEPSEDVDSSNAEQLLLDVQEKAYQSLVALVVVTIPTVRICLHTLTNQSLGQMAGMDLYDDVDISYYEGFSHPLLN